VGYLSFDARNADLLFQLVNLRYERKSVGSDEPTAGFFGELALASALDVMLPPIVFESELPWADRDPR